ncbi:MAG: hypothetical protein JSU63_18555 [Phycisphaerales bacterium]|nr:MAG: hypothetical protein JSU63_18555 [Phycisphaerales bacterium]
MPVVNDFKRADCADLDETNPRIADVAVLAIETEVAGRRVQTHRAVSISSTQRSRRRDEALDTFIQPQAASPGPSGAHALSGSY